MIRIYNKNGVVLNTKDKYCTENIKVSIDSTNLSPENIVAGKVILGVTGIADGSIIIPEGYIKPQGTYTATENGTFDITSYANVKVNVPLDPTGTFENYDGSILVGEESFVIEDNKPLLTAIEMIYLEEGTIIKEVTVQPHYGVAKVTPIKYESPSLGFYDDGPRYIYRFHFIVPETAAGSRVTIYRNRYYYENSMDYGRLTTGELNVEVPLIEEGSLVGNLSGPYSTEFDNLEPGRYFIDVKLSDDYNLAADHLRYFRAIWQGYAKREG